MHTSAVVFIHFTLGDLRNSRPFEEAAKFTQWEVVISFRCDDTGEELQVSCTPPYATCWGWRYFKDQWVRKHGPIK